MPLFHVRFNDNVFCTIMPVRYKEQVHAWQNRNRVQNGAGKLGIFILKNESFSSKCNRNGNPSLLYYSHHRGNTARKSLGIKNFQKNESKNRKCNRSCNSHMVYLQHSNEEGGENMQKGESKRTMVVCIDSYDQCVPHGRFCCPGQKESQPFQSLVQLLNQIEQRLNASKFPQSFEELRCFGPPRIEAASDENDAAFAKGSLATFRIRILFRQNASWQGSILWQEGGQEESFRSVLEFIFLMDSALTGGTVQKSSTA